MDKDIIPQNGAFSIGFKLDEPIENNVLYAIIKPKGSEKPESIKWQGNTADGTIETLSNQSFAVNIIEGLNISGDYEAEFMLKDSAKIIAKQTIPITFTPNTIGKL